MIVWSLQHLLFVNCDGCLFRVPFGVIAYVAHESLEALLLSFVEYDLKFNLALMVPLIVHAEL